MDKNLNEAIGDVFDVDYSEKKVEETTERIAEIKEGIRDQKYNLEDKEYIAFELKNLIETNRMVLEGLGEQCKAGAQARLYEVYANLSNSISQNLSELMRLNQVVTDYQVKEDDMNQKKEAIDAKRLLAIKDGQPHQQLTQNNTTTNFVFTSKELLEMAKDIKTKVTTELPEFNLE